MEQYGIQNISTLDIINIIETDDTGSIILESGYQLYSGSLSMWSETFENYTETYPSFTGSSVILRLPACCRHLKIVGLRPPANKNIIQTVEGNAAT